MTNTEPQPTFSAVRMELDVSPTWWTKIHHRRGGAFNVTISALIQILDRRQLEPIELRADEERLTVVLSVGPDVEPGEYQSHAVQIRDSLTRAVTIEPDEDFRMDLQFEEVGDTVRQQSTTRGELEEVLRECGFVQATANDLESKPDDKDIWTLPGTAARCVQFDQDTTLDMVGTARWMDTGGEKTYTFDTIAKKLAAVFRQTSETKPETHDQPPGILPSTGDAKGGIFGKEGASHA